MFDLFNQIRNGNLEKTREILESEPSLINSYLYGVTPFLYSLECGNEEIALEIAKNLDVDYSLKDNLDSCCLEKAIEAKLHRVVEYICRSSKNYDLNKVLMSNNETFLTNSLKLNDYQTALALIRGGVDLNIPNKSKEYPLQLAIKFNQIEIVKEMLLSKRVNIQNIESISYNPLIDCCEKDLTEIAILLIEKGSNLNVCDSDELWTPLMYAIANNNQVLVEKLVNHKCDINTVDIEGNTPLHLAAMNSDEFIANIILKAQPDKNIKNSNGKTPLDIAFENEDDILISLLK